MLYYQHTVKPKNLPAYEPQTSCHKQRPCITRVDAKGWGMNLPNREVVCEGGPFPRADGTNSQLKEQDSLHLFGRGLFLVLFSLPPLPFSLHSTARHIHFLFIWFIVLFPNFSNSDFTVKLAPSSGTNETGIPNRKEIIPHYHHYSHPHHAVMFLGWGGRREEGKDKQSYWRVRIFPSHSKLKALGQERITEEWLWECLVRQNLQRSNSVWILTNSRK